MTLSLDTSVQQVLCKTNQVKYNKWENAIKWSDRNPTSAISFNYTLSNNISLNNISSNISLPPFHQTCIATRTRYRTNQTHGSATVTPSCILMKSYISANLSCPFSSDRKTIEECECVGLRKTTTGLQKNDKINCICMHNNNRDIVKNRKESCNHNYLFTKQCIIHNGKIETYGFSMNCTFTNCLSILEKKCFNGTSDKTIYPSCLGYHQVKIVPNVKDKKAVTITKQPNRTSHSSTTATTTTTNINTNIPFTKIKEPVVMISKTTNIKSTKPKKRVIKSSSAFTILTDVIVPTPTIHKRRTYTKTPNRTSNNTKTTVNKRILTKQNTFHATYSVLKLLQNPNNVDTTTNPSIVVLPSIKTLHSTQEHNVSILGIIFLMVLCQAIIILCIEIFLKNCPRRN